MNGKVMNESRAYPSYPLREFSSLSGLRGLPEPLIQAHLALYEGYVKNINRLSRHLRDAALGSPEWSELKRRMGFEMNGLRLHEIYFDALTPKPSQPSRALDGILSLGWGTVRGWKEEFEAIGQMRGVGWAILYQDPVDGRLSNHWIGLHEEGHPTGFKAILVMDVWEHAFTGMTRSHYIEAFFANVDWEKVEARIL